MMRRRSSLFLATAAVLVGSFALAGCGGDDDGPAAICSDVEDLKTSVANITTVGADEYVRQTLRDNLVTVQDDLVALRQAAKDEYTTELAAIEEAANSVKASAEAAADSPSAADVAAIATSVKALGTSLTGLEDAVSSTC